jgi:ABC-type Zn uptake system ZnuABC Zn-binding protein ZnuA
MKAILQSLLFIAAALFAPSGTSDAAAARLRVVTFTTDLKSIAESIGGDRVRVDSLVPPGFDADHYVARPSDLYKLHRAQLFLMIGLGFESHAGGHLFQQIANPKLIYADMSHRVPLLDVAAGPVDYSFGDIHPLGNPHYQLNPEVGAIVARNVYTALIHADPDGRGYYEANLKAFEERLGQAMARWRKQMEPYKGARFMPYHNSWSYFAQAFDLVIPATIESKPGFVPSPARVQEVIEIARAENVRLVVTEPYYEVAIAKLVAEQVGIPYLVLTINVGGSPEQKDYISMIDHIVREFVRALGGRGN